MGVYMGDWMMDYVAGRLASAPGTAKVRRGGGDKIGGRRKGVWWTTIMDWVTCCIPRDHKVR